MPCNNISSLHMHRDGQDNCYYSPGPRTSVSSYCLSYASILLESGALSTLCLLLIFFAVALQMMDGTPQPWVLHWFTWQPKSFVGSTILLAASLCTFHCQFHTIIESLRLENITKIILSNHSTMLTKPCPSVHKFLENFQGLCSFSGCREVFCSSPKFSSPATTSLARSRINR